MAALPLSGPISWEMVRAAFGGTYPIYASQYYAGGGLVPTGTSGANGLIPESGPIGLWHFYGALAYPVQNPWLADVVPMAIHGLGVPGQYGAAINISGAYQGYQLGGQGPAYPYQWFLAPSGTPPDYDFRVHVVSNNGQATFDLPSSFDVWYPNNGVLQWRYGYNTAPGTYGRAVVLLEVRISPRFGGSEPIDGAYIEMWSDWP